MAGMYKQDAIWFRQIGRYLGHHASTADPDRAIEVELASNRIMQIVSGLEWRSQQARGTRHVQIRFVHGGHLNSRREAAEDVVNFGRILPIQLHVSVEVSAVRAQLGGST